ncbi:MAG: DUF502 domain-containing protein [Opitutaceae bacterium]|nr:DUF502 domain-containing protein [Opitutaceae bacterium]
MSAASGSTFKSIRGAFLAGLIALSPILVTVFVLNWLVGQIGGNFRDFFLFFLPHGLLEGEAVPAAYRGLVIFGWNVVATVVALAQITLLGYLTRYVAGRFLFSQTERVMERVPLIGAIYHSVKQIVETFSSQNRAVFQKVVLVQFPRPGMWAIGFLTNRTQGEAQARTSHELFNVFIPTTPNPTSGFLVMVPRESLVEMDMTVGEAMKCIISGGAVTPPWPGTARTASTSGGSSSRAPSPPTPPPPATVA